MTCPCQFLFDRRPGDPDLAGTQQAPADQRWNQPSNGGESLHSLNNVIIWWILMVLSCFIQNLLKLSLSQQRQNRMIILFNIWTLYISHSRDRVRVPNLPGAPVTQGKNTAGLVCTCLHMFAQFVHSAFDLTFVQLYIVVQKCLTKTWARQIWKVSASDQRCGTFLAFRIMIGTENNQRCGTFLAFRIMIGTENNNEQYKYSKQH